MASDSLKGISDNTPRRQLIISTAEEMNPTKRNTMARRQLIISTAEEMNPTKRNTMEDVFRVSTDFGDDHQLQQKKSGGRAASSDDSSSGMAFIGVYDGHGGRGIVDFIATRLEENVLAELNVPPASAEERISEHDDDGGVLTGEGAQQQQQQQQSSVLECFERAYLLTDMESRAAGIMNSGACVVTCIIKFDEQQEEEDNSPHSCSSRDQVEEKKSAATNTNTNTNATTTPTATALSSKGSKELWKQRMAAEGKGTGGMLYCANCGDSRAVLGSSAGVATRMTEDHKAEDTEEIARIEATGGFVLKKRVLGILAVSRSLGDHGMKKFVIARPYVNQIKLKLSKRSLHKRIEETKMNKKEGIDDDDEDKEEEEYHKVLIVACDGLWDVFDDEEAVNVCLAVAKEEEEKGGVAGGRGGGGGRCVRVAQLLVDEAISRGSSDNITCVVVYL
jgi:serine/threonine protein phosphatase PrpC